MQMFFIAQVFKPCYSSTLVTHFIRTQWSTRWQDWSMRSQNLIVRPGMTGSPWCVSPCLSSFPVISVITIIYIPMDSTGFLGLHLCWRTRKENWYYFVLFLEIFKNLFMYFFSDKPFKTLWADLASLENFYISFEYFEKWIWIPSLGNELWHF